MAPKITLPRTNSGESLRGSSFSPQLLLVGQLVLVVRCICIHFEQLLLVSSSLLSCVSSLLSLGSSTQLWHTQLQQLYDRLVFVSVAVGELGTPGRGHIQATAAQRNVRSNPLLKAHLGDVAGRKRVRLVCSSESAAQWHHNQRFRLIKRQPSSPRKGKET